MKKLLIFGFVFLIILTNFVSAIYSENNFNPFPQSPFLSVSNTGSFDSSICESGQDFIIQIAPGGCMPAPIRSDLLEEQDVAVFCEIQAIKVNPLINIQAIKSIGISGEYPPEVKTVAFYPSYSALDANKKLNSMQWNSIGYAVIVVEKNEIESSMPDWIRGNLTAKISYNIRDAFGIHDNTFYLPLMGDSEFDKSQGRYAFFDNRGYLRAEDIQVGSASINVYSGRYSGLFGNSKEGDVAKEKLFRENLKVGETSSKIYLPGLDCFSSVSLRLDAVEAQDTRAKIKINSEIIEVKKGETFLDGACLLKDLEKKGLRQTVQIYCDEDQKSETFPLSIDPIIKLQIDGKERDVKVGEYLYPGDDEMSVYLGYAATEEQTGKKENLKIYLVSLPQKQDGGLTAHQVETAALLDKYYTIETVNLDELLQTISGIALNGYDWAAKGKNSDFVSFSEPKDVKGTSVKIVGFGSGSNLNFKNETLRGYYSQAVLNYKKVQDNFQGEKYPGTSEEEKTLGERSLNDLILLADKVYQKQDLKQFCDEFKEVYPNSFLDANELCEGITSYANEGVSTNEIVVKGDLKEISFQGIYQPGFEEYGTVLEIKKGSEVVQIDFSKQDTVYLETLFNKTAKMEGDYVRLTEVLDEENAKFYFDITKSGVEGTISQTGDFLTSKDRQIKKDLPQTFGSKYVFTLKKVNMERVAKVSLHSSIDYDKTEAKFGFNIGIEKRLIQLSPEKTKERIETFQNLISTFDSISDNLGTVVEGMKTACLVTGAGLFLKNLVTGSTGAAIARQEVMKGAGGWNEECTDNEYKGTIYSSFDDCIFSNADKIDAQVELFTTEMNAQNDFKKEAQKIEGVVKKEGGLFGQDILDQEKYAAILTKQTLDGLSKSGIEGKEIDGKKINMDTISQALTEKGLNKYYDLGDLNEIELYANLLANDKENSVYEKRLFTALEQVEKNSEKYLKIEAAKEKSASNGLEGMTFQIYLSKDQKSFSYGGFETSREIGSIPKGTLIQGISYENQEYYVNLTKIEETVYRIYNVYTLEGELIDETKTDAEKKLKEGIIKAFPAFKKIERGKYENQFLKEELKVKYYETDPYKGLPAIVPFDEKNGWYAYMKQTLPSLGGIQTYDQSSRINSFYLCNVGANGIVEKLFGDDTCQMVNLGLSGQTYDSFSSLDPSEFSSLIVKAKEAVDEANDQHADGVRTVNIGGKNIQVGSPESNLPKIECTDIMSPTECQILFNLCDPVMCPRSRCDLGGKYPVDNVVRSGIIGSIALCLPNYQEGIYLPVCLTGVKAGIDGFTAIGKSYVSCLNESLTTGKTIGICDEINSIYGCELLYREGLPLAKFAVSGIVGALAGQGSDGGGEYMFLDTAWKNTQDSVSYFTDFYAVNSFEAFKARSQEEVGTEFCKQSLSLAIPGFGNSLELLTKSDSPPMVNAKFEAIPYTTATDPPMDHYKITYHIYAGNDQGAYYKVYLRGGGGSYYQTLGGRTVASSYVAAGESVSESIDRTFESGYRELCVQVNNEEYCGFGMVSTDFAVNYVEDQYLLEQSTEKNVKSEKECVSGTNSWYSLLNSNLQAGFENAVSPEIYNAGIIRICATEDPGIGTDEMRWVDVGYCDNENTRCWVDKNSLENIFNFDISKDEAIGDLTNKSIADFESKEGFLNDDAFAAKLLEIDAETDLFKRLAMISETFDFVFGNNKKAYLFFLNGGIYGNLSQELFGILLKKGLINLPIYEDIFDDELLGDATISPFGKDFVSDIFRVSQVGYFGIYDFLKEDLCYRYFDSEWHWAPCVSVSDQTFSLNEADKILWSSMTTNQDKGKTKTYGGEEGTFIYSLNKTDYSVGIGLFIDRVLNEDVEVSFGIFTFNSDKEFVFDFGEFQFDTYLFKYGTEWQWRGVNWVGTDTHLISAPGSSLNGKEVREEIGKVIDAIKGKNFYEGGLILFSAKALNYKNLGGGTLEAECSNEEVKKILSEFYWESGESSVACNVLSKAKEREGSFADTTEFCEASGEVRSCYSAVMVIYEEAGLNYKELHYTDYYSAMADEKIGGTNFLIKDETDPFTSGFKLLSEKDKLDLLKPGYQFNAVIFADDSHKVGSSDWAAHSMIFINWTDREKNLANVFDWRGTGTTYQFTSLDLSNNKNFVYLINRFPFTGASVTKVVTPVVLVKEQEKYLSVLPSDSDLAFELVMKDKSLINMKDSNGNTLLLHSSQFNDLEKVSYLLKNGADVNIKNNKGEIALFYAVQTASLEVVELLVTNGADIYSKSNYGTSILDVLKERKESSDKDEIYDYFLWKGITETKNSFNIWNIEEAIKEARNKEGDYSDNMEFIRELFISNLLTYEEVLDLRGGTLFNWQGDIEDVRELLAVKYESLKNEKTVVTPLIPSTNSKLSCSTREECQIIAGKKIMEIAKEFDKDSVLTTKVLNEKVANSFSCLVLQQAFKESSLLFCKDPAKNGAVDYCDGNSNEIRLGDGGKSYGLFQLNSDYNKIEDMDTLEENIHEGINYLLEMYDDSSREGICTNSRSRWELALLKYNSGPKCNGATMDYLTEVLGNSLYKLENAFGDEFKECY